MANTLAIDEIVDKHLHLSVKVATLLVVSDDCLLRTVERKTLALGSGTNLGDIVKTKHHIL